MAFTVSGIFNQAMINPIMQACWTTAKPTLYGSLSADVINVALFGNSGTPNKTDTLANTAYSVGQWITGNETNGGANWPAGGLPLATKTFGIDATGGSVCFGGVSLAGTGNVTVTACYGCLVYDHTETGTANQGLCFNYFGGSQSVTAGTFTVNWAVVGTVGSAGVSGVVFNVTV